MVVLFGFVFRGVVECVERFFYLFVVVDVVVGIICVVVIIRVGYVVEIIIFLDVVMFFDFVEIIVNILVIIFDISCGIFEFLVVFEIEWDGYFVGGVVYCIFLELFQKIGVGIVEDIVFVFLVIRKIFVLDFRNGLDWEVIIRVDGKVVVSIIYLGSIVSVGYVVV